MSVLPIHHTYECTCGILTALYAGVTVGFCDSLKYVSENLKLFKPSMIVLVPLFLETMYKKIWDRTKRIGADKMLRKMIKLSNALLKFHIDLRPVFFRLVRLAFGGCLKLIISGGAPLRTELVKGFNELGIRVLNGYGITECSPLVAVNRNKYYREDSVGVVVPCCEVRIAEPDENGDGEILVKGDNVMLGYYKNEKETGKAFLDGWFKTGDIGRFDKEGFLHMTGRLKNTIILNNGKNVQPEELEEYFMANIPYIKEVVVFPEEQDEGEETTVCAAFVFDTEYLKENNITEPEELLKKDFMDANRKLPTYKQIGRYTSQYTEFEKTTTKKIKRFKIREEGSDAR
jgi:long-chain acyl-CoA synthetase